MNEIVIFEKYKRIIKNPSNIIILTTANFTWLFMIYYIRPLNRGMYEELENMTQGAQVHLAIVDKLIKINESKLIRYSLPLFNGISTFVAYSVSSFLMNRKDAM